MNDFAVEWSGLPYIESGSKGTCVGVGGTVCQIHSIIFVAKPQSELQLVRCFATVGITAHVSAGGKRGEIGDSENKNCSSARPCDDLSSSLGLSSINFSFFST